MSKPLSGVRVVEVAGYVFVPIAGAILADLGADVVKVEPRSGDPFRSAAGATRREGDEDGPVGPGPMVEASNRGKRSITLDLRRPDAHEVVARLVRGADVFVTSYLESTRRRLSIDVDDIRAINPAVIYARGSGWGSRGPMRDRPAYDMTSAWAASGFAHLMVGNDGEPPPMPIGVFDVQAGNALAGAIGIALYQRAMTGEATVVDTALLNGGLWAIQADVTASKQEAHTDRLHRSRPGNALVNWYRTADSRWIYLAMLNAGPRWAELCDVLERPGLSDDIRFATDAAAAAHAQECARELETAFRERTYGELLERMAGFAGAWGPMRTPQELHDVPTVVHNGFVQQHRAADGSELSLVAPPMQFGDEATTPAGPAPRIGEHSEELLLELGFGRDEIAALRATGVV